MVASYNGRSLCSRNIKRTVTQKSDVSLPGGGYELLTRSCCPNPGSITPMLGPSFFETIHPPSDVNSGPGSPGQAEHSMVSLHCRDELQKCLVDPAGGFVAVLGEFCATGGRSSKFPGKKLRVSLEKNTFGTGDVSAGWSGQQFWVLKVR